MLCEISQTEKDKRWGDIDGRVRTFSHRMNKFWESNVEPCDLVTNMYYLCVCVSHSV